MTYADSLPRGMSACIFSLCLSITLNAQKVWVEPSGYSLSDSVRIFVDLNKCQDKSLLADEEIFLFTWAPAKPVVGNGKFTQSNPALAMKREGSGVWSFKMVPSAFYGVDSITFYDNGWRFLVKSVDGTRKTEDLAFIIPTTTVLQKPGAFEHGVTFGQFLVAPMANYLIINDSTGNITIDDILKETRGDKVATLATPYPAGASWLIGELKNPFDESFEFSFSVGHLLASWNEIDIYLKDNSGITHLKSGYFTPRDKKAIDDWRNFFKTRIGPGATTHFYIRVADFASHEWSPYDPMLHQYDDSHLKAFESRSLLRLVLMGSLLSFVVAYYLLWFIVSRKNELAFYALLWAGFLVAVIIPAPIGYYFAINELGVFIKNFYGLSMGWMIGFTLSFWGILGFTVHYLGLKESHPALSRFAIYLMFLPIALLLVGVFNYLVPSWFPTPATYTGFLYFPFTVIRSVLLAVAFIFSFAIGIHQYRKGFKPALFFLIAFLPLTLSAVLVSMSNMTMAFDGRVIGLPPIYDKINNASMILALILFAMAMAYRQRALERENIEATQKVLQAKENELMLKEQELELIQERASKSHLQELDSLKSEFFANISHEFRTPLTLILAQNESLREQLKSAGLDTSFLMVNQNGLRLLDLINQLLDLSTLENGKLKLEPEAIDLIPYLKNLLFSFESLANQKHIKLRFECSSPEIAVLVDPAKMERVIFNLISNAIKFTPGGGEVTVDVQCTSSTLTITITDTGSGIAEDELPYIFDRFYRSKMHQEMNTPGTGIGLALVRELIQLHGGSIDVESAQSRGTSFTISLPYLKPGKQTLRDGYVPTLSPIPEGDDAEIEVEPVQQEGEAILIVEDNHDVRSFLKAQLINMGYNVNEAGDGMSGLQMAREHLPDLILSDVMMPRMDGLEFARAIRSDAHTSHIPLILLTAITSEENKITGLQTGVDAYLTKPFNTKELQVRIASLIQQRKLLRKRFSSAITISPAEVSEVPMDQVFMQKVVDAIDIRISDPTLSLETLCHDVGMSVTHLNRKLNTLIGQSGGKLIRSRRLNRAAELLRKKTATVAEIAYDTGFSDPSNFTRAFKKHFGIAPVDY